MQRIVWLLGLLFLRACQTPVAPLPIERPPATVYDWSSDTTPSSPYATQVPTPFLPASPIPTVASQIGEIHTMTPDINDHLIITVVYDNNAYDPRLKAKWGFAALIEYRGHTILFDTGGDGPTLMNNMELLGIDSTRIESVVLSHAHGDHVGGLDGLLARDIQPTLYLIPSFSEDFKRRAAKLMEVIEVEPGLAITKEMFTTGEMRRDVPEQALVITTDRGLVIVTGCAHPGVIQVVEQAMNLFGGNVHLVLGGFHLRSKSTNELEAIMAEFRRLGVEKVAPCHCTGDQAIQMFHDEYGDGFIQTGVGRVVVVEP
jgi:7,8-dihydropterin-6-yl-methyl-4-(beta-D-ribofuranosyl)aminobenzene 5'-phosphate synthase